MSQRLTMCTRHSLYAFDGAVNLTRLDGTLKGRDEPVVAETLVVGQDGEFLLTSDRQGRGGC